MSLLGDAIQAIRILEGKLLLQVGHAEDMLMLTFVSNEGPTHPPEEYRFHVLCGWRLDAAGQTLKGSFDWYEFGGGESERPEHWRPIQGGSLQEILLQRLLGQAVPSVSPGELMVDAARGFKVKSAGVHRNGDCTILFENHVRLSILPCGSRGEAWVIFHRGTGRAWTGDPRVLTKKGGRLL